MNCLPTWVDGHRWMPAPTPRARAGTSRPGLARSLLSSRLVEPLLMAALIVFGAGTIASRLAPAAHLQPMRTKELFDPSLSDIRSVDQAMAMLPRFIGTSHPTRTQVADGIDHFVRARFYHGYSEYSPGEDWLAFVTSSLWAHLRNPVLPDDILHYPMAACSQQAIVFQAMLQRSGIDYASVRFVHPGHFAVAARTEKGWLFYDSDQEPTTTTGIPLSRILDGNGLIAFYPRTGFARGLQAAARLGNASWGGIDRYPAPRARLFHRATHFASAFGWAVLAALLAGLRVWRLLAVRAGRRRPEDIFIPLAGSGPVAAGGGDRRLAPRVATIMRVGILHSARGNDLCIVRNISSGGALIDSLSDHRAGEEVVVELKNGARIAGTVAWTGEGKFGIRFEQVVDLAQILADRSAGKGERARMPRIVLGCAANLRVGPDRYAATILDMTQQGAKIEIGQAIGAGKVVLDIPGLGTHPAVVKWNRAGRAGLIFEKAILFGELARWLVVRDFAAEPETPAAQHA